MGTIVQLADLMEAATWMATLRTGGVQVRCHASLHRAAHRRLLVVRCIA